MKLARMSEPLGTRLSANAWRKVSSTDETECEAHDGGHDGHLVDVEALWHHVATTIRATPTDRTEGVMPLDLGWEQTRKIKDDLRFLSVPK